MAATPFVPFFSVVDHVVVDKDRRLKDLKREGKRVAVRCRLTFLCRRKSLFALLFLSAFLFRTRKRAPEVDEHPAEQFSALVQIRKVFKKRAEQRMRLFGDLSVILFYFLFQPLSGCSVERKERILIGHDVRFSAAHFAA